MKPESPKTMKPGPIKASGTRTAASATAARPARKPPVDVPSILLEGDAPSAPPVSGPGQRYALGPGQKTQSTETPAETGELPDAYGTKRLHLTARDPHWVYAHWDLTRVQLNHYNSLTANRHLV